MNKLIKWLERVLQVLTILSGVLATVEMVKTYIHRKELKKKANTYLEEELELEGNVRGNVAVYSPELKEQERKIAKLLAITGVGCISVVILHLINKEAR